MNKYERYNKSEKGRARYARYEATTRRVHDLSEERTRVVEKLEKVREEIEWLTKSLEQEGS